MSNNLTKYFCLFVLLIFLFSVANVAADVPFEVFKTKVSTEFVDNHLEGKNIDAVVIEGIPHDPAAEGKDLGYPPPKGGFDGRVKVPIEGIKYSLEFWNVGEMGGEKGFIFKSNYGDAKLTISYLTGQAYRMVGTGEKFGNIEMQEKKDVSTPDIDDFEYDLTFSGGPYGAFYYTRKDGSVLQVAHIVDGQTVVLDAVPEKHYLMYEQYVDLKVTDSSAFEKWMELLNVDDGCSDPNNPKKDTGIRFSDFSGEVSVRPCNSDDDSWYGAELDMVLHVQDHVKTEEDSSAVLTLSDMTTFIMRPQSEIILDIPKSGGKIRLIWGKIKANVKRMLKDGTMDVEMSQAVAGIKGTTFIVEETGSESTLKVIEGSVEFTSKTTGKSQMITDGEMITATKEGLGEKKEFDIAKENNYWEDLNSDLDEEDSFINSAVFISVIILSLLGGAYFLSKNIGIKKH